MAVAREIASVPTTVDLHLHTRHSDGDLFPIELAEHCAERGLKVVACTDHDSLAGYPDFRRVAEAAGLRVIPACEITATWQGREIHCLAYFVDPDCIEFRARIGAVWGAELDWWKEWFGKASAIGVPVDWGSAEEAFGVDRIAYIGDFLDFFLDAASDDPRFAQYPRGEHAQLISDWCAEKRPLRVERPWRPDLREVVGWIHDAGGVAVLAHPARVLMSESPRRMLGELKDLGIAGIEAWTTWHTPQESLRIAADCRELDLITTQGSDYHGPRLKPWAPAPGLLPVLPLDAEHLIEELEAARPRTSTKARTA